MTDLLGLEKAGVSVDRKGFIEVDEYENTSRAGIYAIGDATTTGSVMHISLCCVIIVVVGAMLRCTRLTRSNQSNHPISH